MDDCIATWKILDHGQGVSGHKRTALSIALDGSEDSLISREALECWNALNMPEERLRAIADVDAKVESGLTLDDWRSLVVHPDDPGIQEEGAEFEGELEENENLWLGEHDGKLMKADDDDLEERHDQPEEPIIEAAPGDSDAALQDASCAATRLRLLKRLRDAAYRAHMPAVGFRLETQISQIERGKHAKTEKGREAAAIYNAVWTRSARGR